VLWLAEGWRSWQSAGGCTGEGGLGGGYGATEGGGGGMGTGLVYVGGIFWTECLVLLFVKRIVCRHVAALTGASGVLFRLNEERSF